MRVPQQFVDLEPPRLDAVAGDVQPVVLARAQVERRGHPESTGPSEPVAISRWMSRGGPAVRLPPTWACAAPRQAPASDRRLQRRWPAAACRWVYPNVAGRASGFGGSAPAQPRSMCDQRPAPPARERRAARSRSRSSSWQAYSVVSAKTPVFIGFSWHRRAPVSQTVTQRHRRATAGPSWSFVAPHGPVDGRGAGSYIGMHVTARPGQDARDPPPWRW